jgi:hypothetical protein
MFTRSGAATAQLGAMLDHLIVSSYLFAALRAEPTDLGTEAARAVVQQRLPRHEIGGRRAELCTVHQ